MFYFRDLAKRRIAASITDGMLWLQVASASIEERDADMAGALPQAEFSNGLECKLSCTSSKVWLQQHCQQRPPATCMPCCDPPLQ